MKMKLKFESIIIFILNHKINKFQMEIVIFSQETQFFR